MEFGLQLGGGEEQKHVVLATWWFFHPDTLGLLGEFLGKQVMRNKPAPTEADILNFKKFYTDITGAAADHLIVMVQQHAGDLVYVPAGWLHTVFNKARALKLAIDATPDSDTAMLLYARTLDLISKFLAPLNMKNKYPADYARVRDVIISTCINYFFPSGESCLTESEDEL